MIGKMIVEWMFAVMQNDPKRSALFVTSDVTLILPKCAHWTAFTLMVDA